MLRLKIYTYCRYLFRLCVACIKVFFACLINPRKLYGLIFSFCTAMNESYRDSYGQLECFEKTQTFERLKKDLFFAKCNYFSFDPKVMHPIENTYISTLVSLLNPEKVFEIGTYSGFTTLHFACNSAENATVYTLDLPAVYELDCENKNKSSKYSYDDMMVVELSKKNHGNRIFNKSPYKEKIVELFGDSMHFDFSSYHGEIDMIFIDGSHAYDYVKSDTENAFKMLSKNGIIIWHDFDYIFHREIFKYLNHLGQKYKIYSIPNTRFAIYGESL